MRVLAWDVGLRTLSFCLMDDADVVQWQSIDVQGDKKTVSIEEGAALIMQTLHGLTLGPVDSIIIEQQPAGGHNQHSNVRMKVMSHAIQCYFYTRALMEGSSSTVTFVAASSKFSERPKAEKKATDTVHSKYSDNKKYAVLKVQELLSATLPADHAARVMFEGTTVKKKDDLADAYLLAYYYLRKQAPRRKKPKLENNN